MITNEDIKTYLAMNKVQYPVAAITLLELLPPAAQRIVRHYASQPYVQVIMTIGSLASKKQDAHSDVDLVIICDNTGIPPKETRLAAIRAVANGENVVINGLDVHIWTFGASDDFTIAGQEICTQFFTEQYMSEKTDMILRGFYTQIGMEHPLASLSSIRNATVHVDKDGFYALLRQKIDPYPVTLRHTILGQELDMRLPYYIGRLETAIARDDMPFADKMIHQAIDSAVYIIFALYKQYPNGPKRLYAQVRALAPEGSAFIDYISRLYEDGTTRDSVRPKLQILRDLLAYLHALKRSID